VYLGIVSRLDAPVTGVVLMARTSKAAARLSDAFRTRRVKKNYLAIVEGAPEPTAGTLEHYLRKDERHRKVHVTHQGAPDAQLARLGFRTLARSSRHALLEVELETGRKHQIRVQLAKIGCPIVGDRKYGSPTGLSTGIALHAYRLELEHPVRREPLSIVAPLPRVWSRESTIATLLKSLPPEETHRA
jgi:23S rRNA pseudouridine1911/1915/1917 synthase